MCQLNSLGIEVEISLVLAAYRSLGPIGLEKYEAAFWYGVIWSCIFLSFVLGSPPFYDQNTWLNLSESFLHLISPTSILDHLSAS